MIVRAVLDLPDALRQQEQEPIKRLRRRKGEEGATKKKWTKHREACFMWPQFFIIPVTFLRFFREFWEA